MAFPSPLKRPIREVIDLDILTCQPVCRITSFKDDLTAIAGESERLTYVALFAMAQDVREPRRLHVKPAMHVLSSCCGYAATHYDLMPLTEASIRDFLAKRYEVILPLKYKIIILPLLAALFCRREVQRYGSSAQLAILPR